MEKKLAASRFETSDADQEHWLKQLREAEEHLRAYSGSKANGKSLRVEQSAQLQQAEASLLERDAERSDAVESLRRNEEMLRHAQRIARFGSWELDLTNLPVADESSNRWSDEMFRIFGYEPGQVQTNNANFFHVVHPEDRKRVREAFSQAVRLGTGYSLNHRIVRPDGTVRYVYGEAQAVTDPQTGRPGKMVGIIQDVTERQISLEKLAEQASFLDQARDAIFVRDLENTVIFWNKGAERLYGWSSGEVMGRDAGEFLYASLENLDPAVQAVLEHGEWRGELEQFTKTNDRVIVESRWTLLRDDNEEPKSILVLNSDITERKKIESQLMRSQRIESIGTLAGGIAHDLNNVLAPILLGAALLKGEECSDDMREVVEDIELSARRGSDLVKQVLSFARGKEGLRVSVRLGDIVKEVISIIEKTFSKKISLKIDVAPDLWTVSGDPTQLNQILLNLCVNAGDAMPDGGYLTISARNLDVDEQYAATSPQIEKGKYVLLNVADTGCGIPADKLDRIFDPFFTTKDLGKGTGLGLATVLGVVRSHGGFMNVTSEVDKGTNFIVHLPAQVDTEEAGLIEQSDEDLPRGNGECILLVDDEAPILKVTSKTLQAYGYRVLTASNGAKAVAVFAQNQEDIALVLTDMMMPVMDGPAAIHALLRIRPELKIIGASGLTSKGVMARANLPGVKHFIAKPYSAAGLLKLVRSCLSDGAP
jgi:PAS domain S-box-containing protein